MANLKELRLLAADLSDLAIVSAALQDAVAKTGDIAFDAGARSLTLVLNRYRWEAARPERVRAALQVGSVLSVQTRRIRRDRHDSVLSLLSVAFESGQPPGGVINLTFAGGGDLRVEVECLDVVLADISAPWPTPRQPSHEL